MCSIASVPGHCGINFKIKLHHLVFFKPQEANANSHTAKVVNQLVIEHKRHNNMDFQQFLVPESHSTDVILKGDTSLLSALENQHGETYLNNSEIKHKNRNAELWFLPHHHHLLVEEDTVQMKL